jgi:GNAT superfamily N-acetyltransferase
MTETPAPRLALPPDAGTVARLLDRFNPEFGVQTPGPEVLAARLARLLAGDSVLALLAGEPPIGVALLTLRPNVWWDGRVALLDELYVVPGHRNRGIGTALLGEAEREAHRRGAMLMEINVDGEDTDARRFYERHGYADRDPGQEKPQLYYHRELGPPGR